MHPMMVPLLERMVCQTTALDEPEVVYRRARRSPTSPPDAPPFFVLHGRNDSLIPVEQARSFVARLREVSSQPVVYAELPFAQHAFDMLGSVRAAHAAVAVEQFLAEIYATQHQAVVRQWNASMT